MANIVLDPYPYTVQKLSKRSKVKEHIRCLERRLRSWSSGNLEELPKESRALQQGLPRHQSTQGNSSLARSFSNLMFSGKCKERVYRSCSSFTPLVLSATGSMGNEATTFFKRLASVLADKWDPHYSSALGWLRCRLSFSLLHCAIQAIRGHAASPHIYAMDLMIPEASLLASYPDVREEKGTPGTHCLRMGLIKL